MPAKKNATTGAPIVHGLTGAVVVHDLTAEANPNSPQCKAMLRLASPMGPECGGKIILHDVLVQRVNLIGPAVLPEGLQNPYKD